MDPSGMSPPRRPGTSAFAVAVHPPYGRAMGGVKTRRLEVRTDEETERLVSEASALLHVSKSAFVEEAVRSAAQRVVARADVTLMSAEVFDAMMAALEVADHSPELADLARLPRIITR
ncbi:MAG: DUF1778 domain-containing protein [Jatrophihabitans sp.]|nr:MAG: DUF1778 domain-containing protein [Jatrophihabitans sp.]